jgi:hypothetical protein
MNPAWVMRGMAERAPNLTYHPMPEPEGKKLDFGLTGIKPHPTSPDAMPWRKMPWRKCCIRAN